MLSSPKPLDQIQPILVCELLTCKGRATAKVFLALPPGALGRGQIFQISLNFNNKVNLKDSFTKPWCVLTNERYKTYQTGFSFCRLSHALGVGLGGA